MCPCVDVFAYMRTCICACLCRVFVLAPRDLMCVLEVVGFKVGPLWMSLLEMDSWEDVGSSFSVEGWG